MRRNNLHQKRQSTLNLANLCKICKSLVCWGSNVRNRWYFWFHTTPQETKKEKTHVWVALSISASKTNIETNFTPSLEHPRLIPPPTVFWLLSYQKHCAREQIDYVVVLQQLMWTSNRWDLTKTTPALVLLSGGIKNSVGNCAFKVNQIKQLRNLEKARRVC